MAKNIRRMFAMVLVMCMFVSALPMQALAAEQEITLTETDTISGADVSIDTSAGTVSVSGSNDSGSIVDMSGTVSSGTNPDGSTYTKVDLQDGTETTASGTVKDVDYQETATTTIINHPNGDIQSITVKEGSETKEWTGEGVENVEGYEDNEDLKLPSVEVEVKPGTSSNGAEDKTINETIGVTDKENPKEYDYTNITITVNRDVTVNTTEMEENFQINPDESSVHSPVGPEDYEGKQYYDYSDDKCDPNDQKKYDTHYREGLLAGEYDKNGNFIPYDEEYFANTGVELPDKPTADGYDNGYDMTWTGYGEITDAATPVVGYLKEGADPYLRDDNGEIIIENGVPVYNMESFDYIAMGNKMTNDPETNYKGTGMFTQPVMFALQHENGNYFYAYCMDASTGAGPTRNRWYNITNLEALVEPEGGDDDPNTYITEHEAGMIRAIANTGYWGNEAGKGSVESLKELLRTTYAADEKINVRYQGSNDVAYSATIYDLIDGLTESEALAATQAAIWTFSNSDDFFGDGATVLGMLSASKYHNTRNGADDTSGFLSQYRPAKDSESDARMQALYKALLQMSPVAKDSQLREDSTVIPQEGALTDISLVVEDRVAGHEQNLDDNNDNDVYNVALNFQLAFTPGENDELYIELIDCNAEDPQTIYDANNNPIKKLVSHDYTLAEGENEDDLLRPNKDGVYTLSGLELSENSAFTFDLHLSGTQYLENGVYVYQAHGGRKESQTLVGLAEGEQKVSLSTKMTMEFNVNESNEVIQQRFWRHEEDPVDVTPPTPPEYPVNPVDFEEAAPQVFRLANQNVEEIPEEPVPLAAPVITGDNSGMWIAVILLSVFAMAAINLFDKKRQQETF